MVIYYDLSTSIESGLNGRYGSHIAIKYGDKDHGVKSITTDYGKIQFGNTYLFEMYDFYEDDHNIRYFNEIPFNYYPISKIDENQYRVDGKTTIYDFERFFHVELKDSEDSDVVTLSGYVLDNYHNIHEGETIKLADLNLKIQDYRHSYIDSFIVTTLSK